LTRIFDTFIYSGEEVLLISRIDYLSPYVDFFVIVESEETFSGNYREVDLNFQQQIHSRYGDKIRWIKIDRLIGKDPWEREAFQRQLICDGLEDIQRGDVVMLSDLDEIPSHKYLETLSKLDHEEIFIAEMKMFRYCEHLESFEKWYGTIAFKYFASIPDLQLLRLRAVRYWMEEKSRIVIDGGFHFTTFLNARKFKEKIKSFSHTELNTFPYNIPFFLHLVIKLGVTLDGKEILNLNIENQAPTVFHECHSNHYMDNLRVRIAQSIQPLLCKLFLVRVKKLKNPE
jgi:beta-1,4-mannosyl-glycoprotein beta-1,4-N-acetylglucosaminyltransferase